MDDPQLSVALVSLEVRVILGITGWENLGESVVWTCLGFSLFLADIVLQVQELRPTRAVPAKAQTALPSEFAETAVFPALD
jgi:hypothetical protein